MQEVKDSGRTYKNAGSEGSWGSLQEHRKWRILGELTSNECRHSPQMSSALSSSHLWAIPSFLFCVFEWCANLCTRSAHGGQRRVSDPLELELQMVVRGHSGGPSSWVHDSKGLSLGSGCGKWHLTWSKPTFAWMEFLKSSRALSKVQRDACRAKDILFPAEVSTLLI